MRFDPHNIVLILWQRSKKYDRLIKTDTDLAVMNDLYQGN